MPSTAFLAPAPGRWVQHPFAFFLLLAAFLGSSLAWAAAAPDPAGRVVRTLGVVEAVAPDGTVRRLRRQDPIFEGDTLRTGPQGRGQIRFTDRGLLSLRPDTELSIDSYEYQAASPSTGRQELNLAQGGFRTLTGRVAEANNSAYSVRTPLAVIGVRGTIYDAMQRPGGPLLIGVAQGGIDATTNSGRLARLGVNSGFNFARVNLDGSIEFLIEPPVEFAASAGFDEGEDEEGGGDEEGSNLGSAEESSVGSGGGNQETTAGTPTTSTTIVRTATDPNNTGSINQAETGTGDLPTRQPIFGGVLSDADRAAIVAASDVAIIAGVASNAVGANGEPILGTRIGTGDGIGALDASGDPLLVFVRGDDFSSTTLSLADRPGILAAGDAFLTGDSAAPGPIFDGARTFQPLQGAAGVTWGGFAQPTTVFLDARNVNSGILTSGDNDLLFALGTPTSIADMSGIGRFGLVDSRAASTGGFVVTSVESDATLDFGSGALDGILDVALAGSADLETVLFAYIVDFNAQMDAGLVTNATVFDSELLDVANETSLPIEADITGFLTGSEAEFLNLAFAYSTPGRTDLNVHGLVLLQQGVLPPTALQTEELIELQAGFGYVEAVCCFTGGDTFRGRITDPRDSTGLETIVAAGGRDPLDPLFNVIPADNVILRRDGATVVNFSADFDFGAGAELASFEWQGFNAGGPVGIYDATTGDLLDTVGGNLQFLTGRIADIATLTGSSRYELVNLPQGFFLGQTNVAPQPIVAADFYFDVNFATAQITNGFARLLTDTGDASAPVFQRDRVDARFNGLVALENGNPFARLTVLDGLVFDQDGDTGGPGIVNVDESSLTGFFAGDGSVFNLAFNFTTAAAPGSETGFIEPINLIGAGILTRQNNALSAAEQTALAGGFGYVLADTENTEANLIVDPRPSFGEDAIFAVAADDVLHSDPVFNQLPPRFIVRPDSAIAQFFGTRDIGSADLSFYELQGFSDGPGLQGGPIGVYDSVTGALDQSVQQELLLLTGRLAEVATLTGFRRYSLNSIPQGFFRTDTGDIFGSLVDAGLNTDATIAFNVDFNSALITSGSLRLFTDSGDIGMAPFDRDRVDAFFTGSVATANGNPFVDLEISQGFVVDADADAGGSGILNLNESSLDGFFAGDGSVFNLAFSLESQADPADPGNFVAPVNFLGNAILTQQDLSVTPQETIEFGEGRVFVAVNCCDIDLGAGAGPAGDPKGPSGDPLLNGGNFVVGFNDGLGVDADLGPLDAGFLSPDVERVGRKGDAFGFVFPNFPVPAEIELIVGGWVSTLGSSPFIADAATGEILEELDRLVLFHVGFPSTVAALQAEAAARPLLTFAGDDGLGSPIINEVTLGGLNGTNLQDLDPLAPFFPRTSVGFNINLATGEVYNGHLFSQLFQDAEPGFPQQFGFQVFFDGQVAYAAGNTFIDTTITSGVFGENKAIDLDASEIQIFIAGDGPAAGSSFLAQGAFYLQSVVDPEFGSPVVSGGTFSIGSDLLPETRLVLDGTRGINDAAALNSGRMGLISYSGLNMSGQPDQASTERGINGLLIGRASAATGNDFLLGASTYRQEQDRDPTTLVPVTDGMGLPVFRPANTRRHDFLSQPFDFVVRQGVDAMNRAIESDFNANVVPTGGVSFTGFEVAWGIWNSSGSTDSAVIQYDPSDGLNTVVLDRQLFFASVNPTPQSQLPTTGAFSYTSAIGAEIGSDFLGSGGGAITSGMQSPLDYLTAGFDLDFSSGLITNGSIETGYTSGITQARWSGAFDGFVNGPVADLQLSSLSVTAFTFGTEQSGFPVGGDLTKSEIGGVFTGPAGERFAGGFTFQAEATPLGIGAFEGVSGLFILDRQTLGTMRPIAPPPPMGNP